MKFADYPKAIAQAQSRVLAARQHHRSNQQVLADYNAEIERQIAFDESLTNDTKRKVRRIELQTEEDYRATQADQEASGDRLQELEISLELLKNEFTVAKLITRERIAQLESGPD